MNDNQILALLTRMLGVDFAEANELRSQLSGLVVSAQQTSNVKLSPSEGVPADNCRGVMVDAEAVDLDGEAVFALLHVVEGWLSELQMYRGDGQPIRKQLQASDFTIVYPNP